MTAEPSRRVTILDVAKACGVAPSTVSNALAGKNHVSAETRRRIEETATALGYRGSRVARSLRLQRTFSIGVMLSDIANPVSARIVRGIEDVLLQADCALFLCSTDESEAKQHHYLASLLDRGVDGLVLVSQYPESEATAALLTGDTPFVLVHRRDRRRAIDYVGMDNTGGTAAAVQHLATLGHRRIGFLGGPSASTAMAERYQGYCRTLEALGLPFGESLARSEDYTLDSGYRAGMAMLRRPDRPTAILGSNDSSAIGIMHAALELGLAVPRDLSVVGFDDIALAASPLINLTTIRQPTEEIGRAAAELLLRRIQDGPQAEAEEVILPYRLIVRGTTAAPPDGSAP